MEWQLPVNVTFCLTVSVYWIFLLTFIDTASNVTEQVESVNINVRHPMSIADSIIVELP